MSLIITENLVRGGQISRSSNGFAAVRVYGVVTTAGESLIDIIQDAGIPQYGDLYSVETGTPFMYALEITCQPENEQNTIFTVTVNYGVPDFSQKPPSEDANDSTIQVGSSVSSSKTQKDKDGNQIVVALSGQPDQVGDVDIQIPETVLVFERKESSSPFAKSKTNVGFVNSASLGSGAYAARTLLCLGIDGTSTDDGETWQVTYRFQYRPDTWDALIVYIDPETDRPHDDINLASAGAGWVSKRIYPEVDFSTLSLPF